MNIQLCTNPAEHLPLLLLADPDETVVKSYLSQCIVFELNLNEETVGIVALFKLDSSTMEVKNIAISPEKQGLGLGKKMLQHALDYASKKGFQRIIIKTGNSSINQFALYQKIGFELDEVVYNHFVQHYDTPIFENGIACKHQLVLVKKL